MFAFHEALVLIQDGAMPKPGAAAEQLSIIGLLYLVLAGVGAFLVKVGFDLNKNIQSQTGAVNQLVTELKLAFSQIQNENVAVRRDLTEIRDQLRELRSMMVAHASLNGPGNGKAAGVG